MSKYNELLVEISNICKSKGVSFRDSVFEHRLDTDEITYMFLFRRNGKSFIYKITQEKIDNASVSDIVMEINYYLVQYIFDRSINLHETKFRFQRFDGKILRYELSSRDLNGLESLDVVMHSVLEKIYELVDTQD